MWHAWGRGEVFTEFWLGSPKARVHWEMDCSVKNYNHRVKEERQLCGAKGNELLFLPLPPPPHKSAEAVT